MKTKASIVLGSLVGAALLHAAFTACGTGGTPLANAQSAPSCTSWTTGWYVYNAGVPDTNALQLGQVVATQPMPQGWEPMGMSVTLLGAQNQSIGALVALRQCNSQ